MEQHKALASVLEFFDTREGQLLIGGQTVAELARMAGTPFYAYDLKVAQIKHRMLKAAMPPGVEIHYALKANPHPEVVSCFARLGCGADVASKGELQTALEAGIAPEKIWFTGPGKRLQELEMACEAGIGSLNIESKQELELANEIAARQNRKLGITLRINPSFELAGSGMRMGGGAKPFGIDEDMIPGLLRELHRWPNLAFRGFHLFSGSQNLNAGLIASAFEKGLEVIEGFLGHCPNHPELINLGGGFGIPYFPGDDALDIDSLGEKLEQIFQKKQHAFKGTNFIVESGRYLIGEAGVYVAQVLYRKESRGETFLVLDGGMNHHLAASGNLGQVIKKNYPIVLVNRVNGCPEEKVNVVGPLCTPLDNLGRKVALPRAEQGDFLAVFCSGAYGFSASPLGFLSHEKPKELIGV